MLFGYSGYGLHLEQLICRRFIRKLGFVAVEQIFLHTNAAQQQQQFEVYANG